MEYKTIVWFRQDLRLHDNAALEYAAKKGQIIPIYILDKQMEAIGEASAWWLHYSLKALSESFLKLGHELYIFKGNAKEILKQIVDQTKASNITWNRCYEPDIIKRDSQIKEFFIKNDVNVKTFNASLLFEPWDIKNQQGEAFKVFTPFWKNCLSQNVSQAISDSLTALTQSKSFVYNFNHLDINCTIDDLGLLPKGFNWAKEMEQTWQIGEEAALKKFEAFVSTHLKLYKDYRNFMDNSGANSQLSAHLHFGEISPRHIWNRCRELNYDIKLTEKENESIACFLSEIGWREFGHHLLYHIPHIPFEPIKKEFEKFPWIEDKEQLKKWQKGQTGIPIIDAAMRQLWQTGYMHNRARMIVASFLTKNLLIPWQKGAVWFWNTLVDADLANNSMGWQWVAGCGVDAAPYFRIFNPVTQAQKFDPEGEYIKKWVPELKNLPLEFLYEPSQAKADLTKFGVELGKTYPFAIVDLSETRQRALNAYEKIRKTN